MKYGLLSGMLWALDTIFLGIALSLVLPEEKLLHVVWLIPVAGAFLHDLFSSVWLLVITLIRKKITRLKETIFTPNGCAIILAACLGGPIGMTGYVLAIKYIGPGYTACISAFYPAFGAILSRILLKDRLTPLQYFSFLIALCGVMGMGYLSCVNSVVINSTLGLICALVCVIGWGSEAVLGSYAMRHKYIDNQIALQIRNAISALVYAMLVIPLLGIEELIFCGFRPSNYVFIMFCAAIGTVSYIFYYKAIEMMGASRAMALNISYSAWALVFSVLILDYSPNKYEFLCCLLIILGVIFSSHSLRELRVLTK